MRVMFKEYCLTAVYAVMGILCITIMLNLFRMSTPTMLAGTDKIISTKNKVKITYVVHQNSDNNELNFVEAPDAKTKSITYVEKNNKVTAPSVSTDSCSLVAWYDNPELTGSPVVAGSQITAKTRKTYYAKLQCN